MNSLEQVEVIIPAQRGQPPPDTEKPLPQEDEFEYEPTIIRGRE